MKASSEYSRRIRSTKKELVTEYLIPLVIEFIILALCIAAFGFFMNKGPLLQAPEPVGEEMSKPTVGRLVFGVLALVLWYVLSVVASKAAGKGRDFVSSYAGFAAGIFLWQAIGEISWHFSIGGVHFVPFESVTTFPLACLFFLLMIYGKKHHSFDWGVWVMLLSFAFNWMGHYVMEGTYPFVASLIDQHSWYLRASAVTGAHGFVFSILYLLFRAKTRRGRILASMMTYISIGVAMFGFLEG